MSNQRSSVLLAALLGILAAHSLDANALDPWRGWVAFKEFARQCDELPDQGISVQIATAGDHLPVHLFFIRQVLVREGDRLEPAGCVACEFVFAPRRQTPREWCEWTFDHATFERFVDVVEQNPLVADLLVTRPLSSFVYWEEA
jgi:hypothetical protein